nr:MAG TPA: hypothetical protein [Caudoviricetes sp.]
MLSLKVLGFRGIFAFILKIFVSLIWIKLSIC